jgi:hypothetical protein
MTNLERLKLHNEQNDLIEKLKLKKANTPADQGIKASIQDRINEIDRLLWS